MAICFFNWKNYVLVEHIFDNYVLKQSRFVQNPQLILNFGKLNCTFYHMHINTVKRCSLSFSKFLLYVAGSLGRQCAVIEKTPAYFAWRWKVSCFLHIRDHLKKHMRVLPSDHAVTLFAAFFGSANLIHQQRGMNRFTNFDMHLAKIPIHVRKSTVCHNFWRK